jgi:hypothetical protein
MPGRSHALTGRVIVYGHEAPIKSRRAITFFTAPRPKHGSEREVGQIKRTLTWQGMNGWS